MVSYSRQIVFEALQAYGDSGTTKEQILELIGQDFRDVNPTRSLGQTLRKMSDDNLVREHMNKWYLVNISPNIPLAAPAARAFTATNGAHKSTIAPYAGKRRPKTVTIFTSPEVYENIIGLKLIAYDGDTLKIPVFGSIRICIGMEIPMLSPEQEFYNNVETVELQIQGGGVKKCSVNRKEIVTIAPEEN